MITHPRPWFTSGLMAMLLFVALHVGALSPATGADFDKDMTAYRSGDHQAALAEWRPLAESGHATAQYNLEVMYELGSSVALDLVRAYVRYELATFNGFKRSQTRRNLMETAMSAEQITQAKALARRCRYSNYPECGD